MAMALPDRTAAARLAPGATGVIDDNAPEAVSEPL